MRFPYSGPPHVNGVSGSVELGGATIHSYGDPIYDNV